MLRKNVRYRIFSVPNKLSADLRIMIDDSSRNTEYISANENGKNIGLTVHPMISLQIIRPVETGDNGERIQPIWNKNDILTLTKYTYPIFLENLKGIKKDLSIPDMYTYQGERLELNEELAEKARRPFPCGKTTVEMSVVVILDIDENRVEGIKLKFNNEHSTVLLTLNDIDSLIYNLDHLDIDSTAMMLYLAYMREPKESFSSKELKPEVDILPKPM